MGRVRRFTGRRGLVSVALALLVIGLVGMVVGRLLWPSSVLRPDPKPVLELPGGEVVGGAAVGESVVLVLSERDVAGHGQTTLIRLDRTTGAELDRVVLGPWSAIDEAAEVDGDLVLRLRGRIPGVPGVLLPPLASEDAAAFDDEVWLVVVDGTTLVPIRQYQLPPLQVAPQFPEVEEPLVVIDGVFWMLGSASRRARIDLRTGEAWFGRDVVALAISAVIDLGDELIVAAWGTVRVVDADTGEVLTWFRDEEYPAMLTDVQPVDFRVHENQVWAAPLLFEVDDLPLRLDLETGALVDERPSTSIPGALFESGGSRWELIGRRNVPLDRRIPTPRDVDRWRRVDPETNQVVAVFELGSWRPVFATPDALWVTRDRDEWPGPQVARIPLDAPGGP